jgi:hypothetical protein
MKKLAIACSVAACGLLFAGVTFANVGTSIKNAKAVDKCETIVTNVNKRITNFENNKVRHINQYKSTQAKITALVDKLEAKGYDVTQLRTDLVTYNQNVAKFGTDYATYIADLQATSSYTCGKSAGEFRAKLAISRAELKVVHDDAVAIRTFWATTVKPNIEALRATTPVTTTVEGGSI